MATCNALKSNPAEMAVAWPNADAPVLQYLS